MPDTAQDFLVWSDNADEYAESLIEDLNQQALEDIDQLMTETGTRDADLWDGFGVDLELTVYDYEAAPVDERDLDWHEGLAGMSAAAGLQFFLDERDSTIVKPAAYREQVVGSLVLTRAELVTAGKRSITPAIEAVSPERFARLQARYVRELSFLTELPNAQLYETLVEYKAMRPFEQVVADQARYVSRMTRYRPGSPQFKQAVADLVDVNAGSNLKFQNRRALEGIYSYRAADGDFDTLMVWIGEASACEYCAPLFGLVKTYGEWIEFGLPGADICAGGDRCRCHLDAA